jgi:hypothetical protein
LRKAAAAAAAAGSIGSPALSECSTDSRGFAFRLPSLAGRLLRNCLLDSCERSFSFDQWCEDDLLQLASRATVTHPHSVSQLLDEEGSMDGCAAGAAAAVSAAAAAATRRGGFGPSSNGHLLGQALSCDIHGVGIPMALLGNDSGSVGAAAGSGEGGAVVQGVGRVSSLAGWMTNETYQQAVQTGHPELLLPGVRRRYRFVHGRYDSEEEGSYCSCDSSQDGTSGAGAAAAAAASHHSSSGKGSRLGLTVLASTSRDGGSGRCCCTPGRVRHL